MDVKALAVLALLLLTTCIDLSQEKPFSLAEKCWCRSTEKNVKKHIIRQLKFMNVPNCPLQVIATLRNSKQVCLDLEIKWLQQYLQNALNKIKKGRTD
ncbi:chemokine (C-X-C motif) ligand 12a (stromal cell-derived factor 1) [Erpetoichthys calabaricus]|uniref:Chemokine (C-X-C motif) ligand 12b (stromal cell-derived factor 1) n=1 Tax=Erpetoichthys calabaricus TaxID=27687 RepID=A0A8C4TMZ2_ERPCA|nr:chemokine (C-X-C motif) ligand 12a (stromal cell-derived factor 1) [Erpetoichthys calabaricus]